MKPMTPQEKEALLTGILKVLSANQSKYALGLDAVTLHVASGFGFPEITAAEVARRHGLGLHHVATTVGPRVARVYMGS